VESLEGEVSLLLGLEVVEEDGTFLALLTPVADDDAGAVDDLAGVAFTVEDACDEEKIHPLVTLYPYEPNPPLSFTQRI
jgi:hypothetical protein